MMITATKSRSVASDPDDRVSNLSPENNRCRYPLLRTVSSTGADEDCSGAYLHINLLPIANARSARIVAWRRFTSFTQSGAPFPCRKWNVDTIRACPTSGLHPIHKNARTIRRIRRGFRKIAQATSALSPSGTAQIRPQPRRSALNRVGSSHARLPKVRHRAAGRTPPGRRRGGRRTCVMN